MSAQKSWSDVRADLEAQLGPGEEHMADALMMAILRGYGTALTDVAKAMVSIREEGPSREGTYYLNEVQSHIVEMAMAADEQVQDLLAKPMVKQAVEELAAIKRGEGTVLP